MRLSPPSRRPVSPRAGAPDVASGSDADLIAVARELARRLPARAAEIEAARRLPGDLRDELAAAGFFRLCIPRAIGGREAAVAELLGVIEAISGGDAATGWCVMIGATSAVISAYLPADIAAPIYGNPAVVTGGVFAPRGQARIDADDLIVSGRWPFASGCEHCDWLMGGAVLFDGDQPRRRSEGGNESRLVLFRRTEATIIDTWQVCGLQGTGSHDIAVSALRVPAARSVALATDRPRHDGALYAFPVFGLLALGIGAVALGIARHALDELASLVLEKKTPSGRALANRSAIQASVAQAEASLGAARAWMFQCVDDAWQAAQRQRTVSPQQRAHLRMAATHATASAAAAVDTAYTNAGGAAIYHAHPLQRCFRDVHVATQHMMVAMPTWELCGRVLLGLEADLTQL